MSIDLFRGVAIVAAIASTGYVGAVFIHWSTTVMPAVRGGDDQFFLTSFKALNAAILNPVFIGFGFTGSVVFLITAGALQLGAADRAALLWIVIALALYLVAVVITVRVHLPLNSVVEQLADPALVSDPAAVREQFQESRWVTWNHIRAGACTLSCGSLMWSFWLFAR